VLLCLINLANYIDRFLVVALAPLIAADLGLSDGDQGWLLGAFVIVYTLASPPCGWIADRIARRYVIGTAVGLWSVATAAASRAPTFKLLFGLRGAVGVGEAGYNAAGQALLVDLFPKERRNKVLALFSAAVPIGSAIGFLLGGKLPGLVLAGSPLGWRGACLWVGLPGLALALASLWLPSPNTAKGEASENGGTVDAYRRFLRDPIYMANALGYAMQAFALGGLSSFGTNFFMRTHGLAHDDASILAGGVVAVAGAIGTLAGSLLADALARGNLVRSYALVTGAGYLVAAPILAAGLFAGFRLSVACIFVSMIGTFLGTGPTNAICTERAPERHRASAFALLVVIIHLLGDAASPVVVGDASDWLHAGGADLSTSLQRALVLAPVALALAGVFMLLCAVAAHRAPPEPTGAADALECRPEMEDGEAAT
jgi:MFS family permease